VVRVIFETHSISEDNEAGRASGWQHSRLSPRGRQLAAELGRRRRGDRIDAVFSSDLERAVETVQVAFGEGGPPRFFDWRLRECDYGERNGAEADPDAAAFLDTPYPGGESWRQAVQRVGASLRDLQSRWDGQRVLVVGHVATRWALEYYAKGIPLDALVSSPFEWQEGWEYALDPSSIPAS
jgi:broad specificity phosphatase PhoE